MDTYPNISKEEIEHQYFLRGLRPDYDVTVLPDWVERSECFVEVNSGILDLEYGPAQRNKLDYFPAESGEGDLALYIHGGFWQRGDKSVYRFLAQPFLEQGISVALINYPMCPDVRLSEIVGHVRLAVVWLWHHSDELAFSRNKLNIIGHSAGGHLTAELLMTDWSSLDNGLPDHLIHAGIGLSGLYDLEPLLYCSENAGLKLGRDEAIIASPVNQEPEFIQSMLVGYGLNEPPEMHRQSTDFFNRFKTRCQRMECYPLPDADHFDVVNILGDQDSHLFKQVLSFIFDSKNK